MKKTQIRNLLLLAAFITLLFIIMSNFFGNHYNEENDGQTVSITWEQVNVREGHSTNSKIITSLHEGELVTLTGNSFEYFGGDGRNNDSWTEVQLSNGTIGWVVTPSIDWWY